MNNLMAHKVRFVIYLPVLSNNCNNIFLQCEEAPVYTPVVLAEEQPYIT